MPSLQILTGDDVLRHVEADRAACVDTVALAYRTHARGDSNNPPSGFLRFPHKPDSRIISLPAYLGGEFDVAGIKWIASFPANTARGLPRASAILVLNDTETGYPLVCMESSVISATRTAASAVLAAEALMGDRRACRVGFVGTGLIAGHVWKFLRDLQWQIDGFRLFDLAPSAAESFAATLSGHGVKDVAVVATIDQAFTECDLVILATVASQPHLHEPSLLAHNPVVLHLSLRDLSPTMILASQNITDDVDHALREGTSLDLAQQEIGHRDFVHGTIVDVIDGTLASDPDRPSVFSPFGLGVLDLAVAKWVYDRAAAIGGGLPVPDFYGDAVR